jgi:serine/threonine protein kinase
MPPFDDDDEEKAKGTAEVQTRGIEVDAAAPDAVSEEEEEEEEEEEDDEITDTADRILAAVAAAPSCAPPPDYEKGTLWAGRYRLEERLGRGAKGTVYLAHDGVLERAVALKIFDASADARETEERAKAIEEAKIAARLEHERIARIYDVGEYDGSAFVAMEYVRGPTMRDRMRKPRTPAEAVSIVIQIAEGLSILHERGVVHRDLKPENVMLPPTGVKLLDFGLARHVVSIDTSVRGMPGVVLGGKGASTIVGTPEYMAPEQYRGENADARVDIFALGIISSELVVGERPFRGENVRALRAAIEEQAVHFDAPQWNHYPPGFSQIVGQMLERDQAKRLANGAEALRALRELPSPPAGVHAPPPPPRKISRRTYFFFALVPFLLLLGVGLKRHSDFEKRLRNVPYGMALIDAGTIRAGHTQAELDKECAAIGPRCDRKRMQRELPGGSVEVAPFFLDRHEVTNEQMTQLLNLHNAKLVVDPEEDTKYPRYVRFAEGAGHQQMLIELFRAGSGIEYTDEKRFRTKPGFETLPVTRVTWFGAQLYCEWYNKRLPTENEWEAAARGKENRAYPWGNAAMRCGGAVLPAEGTILMEPGCPAGVVAAPVGTAPQDVTPEGIHDLAGNVAEWTSSVYDEHDRLADPDLVASPDKPGTVSRVVRGGSWAATAAVLGRSTGRSGHTASLGGANVGFRCARSP